MNLIILHGNGLTGQINKLQDIKSRFDPLNIVEISGKESDFEKAVVNLSTSSLFSQERLVILEDFEESLDISKLPSEPDLTIVVRFPKALHASSKLLKSASSLNSQIILVTETDENTIFPFLDKLSEKRPQALLELDPLLEQFGGQYVLTMVFYMFRRLIQKPKKLPEFILRKLELQRRNFDPKKIKALYHFALETDFKMKNGLIEEKLGLTLILNRILTA